MSTPLHIIFVGKGSPVTFNLRGVVGETVVPSLGGRVLYLCGTAFEAFIFMDSLVSVEYSEPGEAPASIRESVLVKYERSVVFGVVPWGETNS